MQFNNMDECIFETQAMNREQLAKFYSQSLKEVSTPGNIYDVWNLAMVVGYARI